MPRLVPSSAAVVVATLFATSAVAVAAPLALLDDRFDGPGATRGDDVADPLDVAFHTFGGAALAVDASDGTLQATGVAPFARFGSSTFAPATLVNVGDRVSVRFDIRATASAGRILSFCFGLYDSDGTAAVDDSSDSRDAAANDRGYLMALTDDPSNFYSSIVQRDESGETLSGESGNYVGGYRFADSAWHTYELTVTRTATGGKYAFAYDGVVRADGLNSGGLERFDNVQFGVGQAPFSFQLDNLAVTYTAVPEPTTLAAGVAAVFGLARRRRRREGHLQLIQSVVV